MRGIPALRKGPRRAPSCSSCQVRAQGGVGSLHGEEGSYTRLGCHSDLGLLAVRTVRNTFLLFTSRLGLGDSSLF